MQLTISRNSGLANAYDPQSGHRFEEPLQCAL